MKRGILIIGAVALVVLVFLLALVPRLPLVPLLPLAETGVQVTDLQRSSLLRGRVQMDFPGQPGLARILTDWRWCPDRGLLSWCVAMESLDMNFTGDLSLGLGAVEIRDGQMALASLRMLGIDPALASAQTAVRIDQLVIENIACPINGLRELQATLQIQGMAFLGVGLGDGELVARAEGGLLQAVLTGDRVAGQLDSADMRAYSGNLVLDPPPEYRDLLAAFAAPREDGQYAWSLVGEWTCENA